MKRIALIFSMAGGLALTALVIGRRPVPTQVEPPAPPIPQVEIIAPPQPPPLVAPPVASLGSIRVDWRMSDPLLALGGDHDEYLKVDLTGVDAPTGQRAPVNVAVVLDRSGSMAGEKLESARRAAHALVDRLDEHDRLAFITFGSNVTPLFPSTLCTAQARGTMHRAIDRIYDMGGTNLSGGLEAGLREVEAHGEGFAVNHVVLISDGEANEGVVTRAGLAAISRGALRQGVTVTALGVGADFDEDTMQELAEEGGGNYRFLQTGGELEPIFDTELKQMATTVASGASLHLQLARGVSVAEVFGYSYEADSDGGLTIHLPDFAAGEHRKVVVQLRAPANQLGTERLVDAKLAYTDLLRNRAAIETGWQGEAEVVPNQAVASLHRDKATYAQVARVHAAFMANKAATLYSSGHVADAERELTRGRDEAQKFNEVAQDPSFKADLDRIAPEPTPATGPAPLAAPPSSEVGRVAAKKMKQDAFTFSR